MKRVSRQFYDLSVILATEFASSRSLRMHVDCNEDERLASEVGKVDPLTRIIQKWAAKHEAPSEDIEKNRQLCVCLRAQWALNCNAKAVFLGLSGFEP